DRRSDEMPDSDMGRPRRPSGRVRATGAKTVLQLFALIAGILESVILFTRPAKDGSERVVQLFALVTLMVLIVTVGVILWVRPEGLTADPHQPKHLALAIGADIFDAVDGYIFDSDAELKREAYDTVLLTLRNAKDTPYNNKVRQELADVIARRIEIRERAKSV